MEDKIYNKKALILGVHKCLTEWLKGHSYVCCDSQRLVNAWTSFHTQDETTMKMFYWLHQHGRLEQSLNFEIQTVVNRMTVDETPHEMAEYNFPPMDVIVQFLQSWCNNRILSLKKNIDHKQQMMVSWSAFDLHDDQTLKAYAKVFASGNIADVANFEEQNFVSSQPMSRFLRSIVDKFVSNHDDIEKQLFDSEVGEISDDNVKKMFSDFLTKMEKKNEQLRKYFQPDDVIRLREEEIKKRPASTSSKPAVSEIVPIQYCDKASRKEENEETVQISMTEQSVDARQNCTYSDVAKVGMKEEYEAEEKVPASRSPNSGKRRSNFQLPTERSAKTPKVDEWVEAEKVSRREGKKDVLPEETGVTSKPIATGNIVLKHEEMRAANIEKKNLEPVKKLQGENEEETIASAKIEKLNFYVTRFHNKLEEFKKIKQSRTDELAKRIATRFIEKRVEDLCESMKNNEDNTQQVLILYFYKLMKTLGLDLLDREHFEQLCMLYTNYKEQIFSDLEIVFLINKELHEKLEMRISNAKKRVADDPVAARQVFDSIHFRYISIPNCSKRDVNRTNAKLYLDTRINSLSKTGEGNSNDSSKLEIYQAVSGMDFDNVPLEMLQQMGMMNMIIHETDFLVFEPILLEILKSFH